MKEQGLILVISGPAGSGKGTVVEKLMRLHGDEFALSISCTTREPRHTEKDGVHYFFITKNEFEQKIREGAFLEYAEYVNGNFYGTPADYVQKKLDAGVNVILEIDVQGGLQVKRNHPGTVLIMLAPPDCVSLEARLRGRGTNTEEDILGRLQRAREELEALPVYDYLVISYDGRSEEAAEEIYGIMKAEKRAAKRRPGFINEFYGEAKEPLRTEEPDDR